MPSPNILRTDNHTIMKCDFAKFSRNFYTILPNILKSDKIARRLLEYRLVSLRKNSPNIYGIENNADGNYIEEVHTLLSRQQTIL